VYELAILATVVAIICLFVMIRRMKGTQRKATQRKETVIAEDTKEEVFDDTQQGGLTRVLPVGMLIAKSGSHRGLVYPIEPSGLKIGRDKTRNQIIIESAVVSREHAWVGLENGNVVIKDLNSQNGTYINSLEEGQIQTAVLKEGDVIFIGRNGSESYKYKAG
jgi:pSer/pThr/pTyr-binding forkhead associated (FHA) protein